MHDCAGGHWQSGAHVLKDFPPYAYETNVRRQEHTSCQVLSSMERLENGPTNLPSGELLREARRVSNHQSSCQVLGS